MLIASVAIVCAMAITACGSGSSPSVSAASGNSNSFGQLAFAKCMRSHGVPSFPDPGAVTRTGSPAISVFGIVLPSTIDVSSPAFKSAMSSCLKLVTGAAPHSGVSEARRLAALKYAQCMRKHGVTNYPDPTFIGVAEEEKPLSVYGINAQSPAVIRAEKTCNG
ncbi:MAG: hypothetical protein ACLP8S_08010 [Solirubrobacteraceae bacterium]